MRLTPPRTPGGVMYTTNLRKRRPSIEYSKRVKAYITRSKGKIRASLRHVVDEPRNPRDGREYIESALENIEHTRRARGAHGQVYSCKASAKAKRALNNLRNKLTNVLVGNVPIDAVSRGSEIAIKVSALSKADRAMWNTMPSSRRRKQWSFLLDDAVNDASVHHDLATRESVLLVRGGPVLDTRRVVPRFYFGGVDPDAGVYVTVAEYIDGIKPTPGNVTPMIVARIEQALLTLHARGVAHADVHHDNIIVRKPGGQGVTVIDFGLSTYLPPVLENKARRVLAEAYLTLQREGAWPEEAVDALWYGKNGIGTHVDEVMRHTLTANWYNPNGKFILYLKTLIPDKRKLDAARKKVWAPKLSSQRETDGFEPSGDRGARTGR